MDSSFKRFSFVFAVLFFATILSGTKACQEDYFFATQVQGIATNTPEVTGTPDGTGTSTPTATGTISATVTPDPDDTTATPTATPSPSVAPTGQTTVSPTPTVTRTPSTAALLSGFSFKSDLPDATKEDLKEKENKKSINSENNEFDPNTELVKPSNWLGGAFSKGKSPKDSDGDGFSNEFEIARGTNPNDPKSFPDMSSAGRFDSRAFKTDTDRDGCNDTIETGSGRDPLSADNNIKDTDGDCLTDDFETENNLGQSNNDSDSDGLDDGAEIGYGTNPYNKDTDGDGILDGKEIQEGTDPLVADR